MPRRRSTTGGVDMTVTGTETWETHWYQELPSGTQVWCDDKAKEGGCGTVHVVNTNGTSYGFTGGVNGPLGVDGVDADKWERKEQALTTDYEKDVS